MVHTYPEMFSFIELPKLEEMKRGNICVTEMEDFQGVRHRLKKWWLYVAEQTYHGMMHVVTACLKLNNLNFFNANFGKYVTLEVFESVQTDSTQNVSFYRCKDKRAFIYFFRLFSNACGNYDTSKKMNSSLEILIS